MSDVTCPYCKTQQKIGHDDGYGYEEDGEYEQGCSECGKVFLFTTRITYSYSAFCQDGDHVMKSRVPNFPDMEECVNCEFYRLKRTAEKERKE